MSKLTIQPHQIKWETKVSCVVVRRNRHRNTKTLYNFVPIFIGSLLAYPEMYLLVISVLALMLLDAPMGGSETYEEEFLRKLKQDIKGQLTEQLTEDLTEELTKELTRDITYEVMREMSR